MSLPGASPGREVFVGKKGRHRLGRRTPCPIYYRVLVTRQSVGPEFTDALVERYLAGSRDR